MIRIAILLALAAACGDKKEDAPQPVAASGSAPAGSGSAPAGSGSAVAAGSGSAAAGSGSGSAAPVAAQADVPTEVDFEDDATARITEKNIDVELKAIEKQLAQ